MPVPPLPGVAVMVREPPHCVPPPLMVGAAGVAATYAVTVAERVLEPQELLAIAVTDLVPVEDPLTV